MFPTRNFRNVLIEFYRNSNKIISSFNRG